jgi:hypothetical protein
VVADESRSAGARDVVEVQVGGRDRLTVARRTGEDLQRPTMTLPHR